MQPAIYGLSGERLSPDERDFFRDADPAGYILFRRNCTSREQLRALTDALRGLSGRDDLPILIDQEGGRVARMQPPEWPAFPAQGRFAELYRKAPASAMEAASANAQAMAVLLQEVGISVNCLPLLDLHHPEAHDIMGDRTLGSEPMEVAALGRAVLEGLAAGGVVGIVKHMPGHGRSASDSHGELPTVTASEEELQADLEPFRSLRWAPMAMTAHILYTVWDAERCASLSPAVIGDIIRGRIGFDNFLMSDDIGMNALTGDLAERARGVVAAGCDVALHCSGEMSEMVAVASGLGEIGEEARTRLTRAMAGAGKAEEARGYQELAAKRNAFLAYL